MTEFWILVFFTGWASATDTVSMRFDNEAECIAAHAALSAEYHDHSFIGAMERNSKCIQVRMEQEG